MSRPTERDLHLEHAREQAEGRGVLEEQDSGPLLESEREAAQGVEVFEDPDATIPAAVLEEGPPGEEGLTGDGVGLSPGDDQDREGESEQGY